MSHGYKRSMYDSCVYFKKLNDDSFIYLLLYVDNMPKFAKDMTKIYRLKQLLNSELERKDLGATKKFLAWR